MSASKTGDRHVAAPKTTLPYDPRRHTLLRRRLKPRRLALGRYGRGALPLQTSYSKPVEKASGDAAHRCSMHVPREQQC